MTPAIPKETLLALAEAVRETCVRAALDGYEQAGMSGLCGEGRWEMAVDAMQSMKLDDVVQAIAQQLPN